MIKQHLKFRETNERNERNLAKLSGNKAKKDFQLKPIDMKHKGYKLIFSTPSHEIYFIILVSVILICSPTQLDIRKVGEIDEFMNKLR